MFKIKIVFGVLVCFFTFYFNLLNAQNLEKTKERIGILSSKKFAGRGYVGNAAELSAKFISVELSKSGLKKFGDSYFQDFYYPVNTFPGRLTVKLNNKKLIPGIDYLIGPACPKINKKYELWKPDSLMLNDTIGIIQFISKNLDLKSSLFVIDYAQTENIDIKKFYISNFLMNNSFFAGIVELIPEELMWSVSRKQQSYPVVKIKRESYINDSKTLFINVNSELKPNFKAKNIIAYIPGKKDDFVVFTAHYDHLGKMGKKVYMPGAQDNASGTAFLLDLADYYSKNKPEYSIAFMFFFGEEAGLLGSLYYVLNPIFDLEKIKVLVNIDMAGTGDEGIMIVNAANEKYEKEWNLFQNVNAENHFFEIMKSRDIAANSDHYPFHEMGVSSVFIYTMGGKTYYHHPKDKLETLTFGGYNQLFGLLTKFVENYD